MFSANFKGQKYASIKKDLLNKGELFVDPEFPPTNKSLFFSKIDRDIEWKRPKVVSNYKEQEWSNENPYAGIFRFSFWRFGEWVDVVIDDMLPTKNGKLVFCHSKARNEFWSALLEKAYAKDQYPTMILIKDIIIARLYGDYETLMSGYPADALVDFTGGVAEKVDYNDLHLEEEENAERHFLDLLAAAENKALIICNIACGREEMGEELEQGLIKGHGYGVTAVRNIKVTKGMKGVVGQDRLQLMRLSNPWGTKEWTGAWSDDSREWQALSLRDREEMGLTFEQEGEFWMCFADFIKYFSRLDICHFVNTSVFSLKKTWSETMVHGEWIVGARGTKKDRAGGCEEYPRTFLYNPQYVFDITPATGDTFMVSLEQHDTGGAKMTGEDHKQIGFHIMRVEENRKFRVHVSGEKMWVSAYQRMRSIFDRVTLNKGRYVIIPSTREPSIAARFLLRMYTSAGASSRELVDDCPKKSPLCCVKGYSLATRIAIKGAEGLQSLKDPNSPPSPLLSIKCEGETYKTGYCLETANPEWTCNLVYYRKKLELPITIEVYNHKTLIDEFLGMAELTDLSHDTRKTLTLDLWGKGKEKEIMKPGKLILEIESNDDLTAF